MVKLVQEYLDNKTAIELWKEAKKLEFGTMLHRGSSVPRLVAVQGKFDNEWVPIYRHPVDDLIPLKEWTGFVRELAKLLSADFEQEFNHVLIQYYRNGNDYISEHSDKTVDLAKGSCIVNFSLGSTRTMVLRSKQKSPGEQRMVQKFILPHNSVFVLDLAENRIWLHQIKKDPNLSSSDEFGGERISFTFRSVTTFINPSKMVIYGTGATSKSKSSPAVINNSSANALLQAFSAENKTSDFDWESFYGKGFDCIDSNIESLDGCDMKTSIDCRND